MTLPIVVLACLAGYVIGGIPVGVIIARRRGIDILKTGSGNPGAANVGRQLGFRWGVMVLALDACKGFAPTVAAGYVFHAIQPQLGFSDVALACGWLLTGICSVFGHNHSPFLGFRGGKGVATFLGVGLGVYPDLTTPTLVAVGVWASVVGITRISSAGSMSAAIAFPLAYIATVFAKHENLAERWPFLAFAILASVTVLLKHRANLARLSKGTEPRLGRPQ